MDKEMQKLEQEILHLKEQNKILLQSLEKHMAKESSLRKELFKISKPNPPIPSFEKNQK